MVRLHPGPKRRFTVDRHHQPVQWHAPCSRYMYSPPRPQPNAVPVSTSVDPRTAAKENLGEQQPQLDRGAPRAPPPKASSSRFLVPPTLFPTPREAKVLVFPPRRLFLPVKRSADRHERSTPPGNYIRTTTTTPQPAEKWGADRSRPIATPPRVCPHCQRRNADLAMRKYALLGTRKPSHDSGR